MKNLLIPSAEDTGGGPLFLLASCSRNDLIKQIEWLRTENEMLRKRLKQRVLFNPHIATPILRRPKRWQWLLHSLWWTTSAGF